MPVDRLVSQNAPSLINGVSRQPAAQRLPSQAQEQTNMLSDVALGVLRRPPMEHIALLAGSAAGAAPTGGFATHLINRGPGEQFVVLVEDGDINVFNLTTGAEVTVNDGDPSGTPGSYAYLNITPSASVTAENSFELLTVADYTFVINKRITAAMSGTPSAGRTQAHEFIFFAKQGLQAYERVSFTFAGTGITMPATGTLDTQDVVDQICTGLGIGLSPSASTGVTAGSTNWRFTRYGKNTLYGYQFQNANEELTVSVGAGDSIDTYVLLVTSTTGASPQTTAFSDLPYVGVDGFVVKISGSEGSDEDEYYVSYNQAKKIWEETRLPGLDNSFSAVTMPHALVYSGGAFTFQPLTWNARLVGDSVSAPQPSFIGQQIKGVTLHKNRLIFAADENVIASEAGSLFNFWPTTVTTLVDSDTWDVAGTGDRVSRWDHMINFEGNVTLFSSVGDAIGEVVGATDAPLTVKNARVEERGTYAFSDVRPRVLGNGIYFVLDRGGSSGLFRYAKTDAFSFRADEITGHVRGYIPANIDHLKSGSSENLLVARSSDETNTLYVYRTHTLGNEQVMASWSKWTCGIADDILNFDFIESILYVFVRRSDGLHLEKIDFGKDDEDAGAGATPLGYRVHLDSLVSLTGTYSAVTGYTSWTLPYNRITGETYKVVKGGAWGNTRGALLTQTAADISFFPTLVLAAGDYSAHACYIGRVYESLWQPSESVLTGGRVTGSAPGARIAGRLQVYNGRVQYANTGAFDVYVTSTEDDDEYVIPFRSQYVNQAILGPVAIASGVFQFPVGGNSRNTEVTFRTSSFLPAGFSAYEWEGRFVQRSDSA